MFVLNGVRLAVCIGLLSGFAQAASNADILIGDANSQPESLTAAPGGVLIVGSASSPFVYRVRAGSSTAEKFIDASAEGAGTFFFGMLADATSNTLWTCQLTPVPNTTPVRRHTALRGFDLSTGAAKLRWDLPGDDNMCNDFTIGPDKALYISDTVNGKIFRLAAGASTAELYLEHRTLKGIDGITFLDGTLYVNNVIFNKLYRIPVDADGKPGTPVDIWTDQLLKGPDGMRAANGKLFVAENASGRISEITVNGDKASVIVLKEAQNSDRNRACRRHSLVQRARDREGRVDSDAEIDFTFPLKPNAGLNGDRRLNFFNYFSTAFTLHVPDKYFQLDLAARV